MPAPDSNSPALRIEGPEGARIFGLSGRERLTRQFARAGVLAGLAEDGDKNRARIIVRTDALIDAPLVPLLASSPGLALLAETGELLAIHAPAGTDQESLAAMLSGQVPLASSFRAAKPSELGAGFWEKLRKREVPYALIAAPGHEAALEWRVFMGTYKGATDIITKRLWPRPAFLVTRAIAPLGVTPNQVTMIGAIATVLAFWLFLKGEFALGLAAAWLMTFLDTVDGKLARTTLTSSKWGDVFDHGIDLVHPPFWYYAWAAGLLALGYPWSGAFFWGVFAAILGGYVLQRLMEGIAIKWLGMEIHIWRKADTFFREITARRNPNLIILTASLIAGRPDIGLVAVAAWTLICLALHGLQLAQAFRARPLKSWMSERA